MKMLALDAAGRFSLCALQNGANVVCTSSVYGQGAVRAVYTSVDLALARAGLQAKDLDAIVVNTGPGSWTATRIAVTYTAGMAFGAGLRVFGYSGFAVGKRLDRRGVAFIDQLGKTISEEGTGEAGFTVNLFGTEDGSAYLDDRRAWMDEMLKLGAEALASDAPGDPLELRTTYFQEFLAGARN